MFEVYIKDRKDKLEYIFMQMYVHIIIYENKLIN